MIRKLPATTVKYKQELCSPLDIIYRTNCWDYYIGKASIPQDKNVHVLAREYYGVRKMNIFVHTAIPYMFVSKLKMSTSLSCSMFFTCRFRFYLLDHVLVVNMSATHFLESVFFREHIRFNNCIWQGSRSLVIRLCEDHDHLYYFNPAMNFHGRIRYCVGTLLSPAVLRPVLISVFIHDTDFESQTTMRRTAKPHIHPFWKQHLMLCFKCQCI